MQVFHLGLNWNKAVKLSNKWKMLACEKRYNSLQCNGECNAQCISIEKR